MNNGAHEPFWAQLPLIRNLYQQAQQTDSGWQRNLPAQDTDGIPLLGLPDIIGGVAGGPAWPGPTGTRTAAYKQEQQRGNTPIPQTAQDTPGEVPAHKPEPLSVRRIAEMADLSRLPTVPSLKDSPEWVHGEVPNGQNLPVQRQVSATRNLTPAELPSWISGVLPVQRLQIVKTLPGSANGEKLDEMLQTMRTRSGPLPPGFSDPNLTPDLPTEKQTPEQAATWLNSAPPVLAELPQDTLAASDRWTVQPWAVEPSSGLGPIPQESEDRARLLAIPEEAMKPDLGEDEAEPTQASALIKLRFCEHKKESNA